MKLAKIGLIGHSSVNNDQLNMGDDSAASLMQCIPRYQGRTVQKGFGGLTFSRRRQIDDLVNFAVNEDCSAIFFVIGDNDADDAARTVGVNPTLAAQDLFSQSLSLGFQIVNTFPIMHVFFSHIFPRVERGNSPGSQRFIPNSKYNQIALRYNQLAKEYTMKNYRSQVSYMASTFCVKPELFQIDVNRLGHPALDILSRDGVHPKYPVHHKTHKKEEPFVSQDQYMSKHGACIESERNMLRLNKYNDRDTYLGLLFKPLKKALCCHQKRYKGILE